MRTLVHFAFRIRTAMFSKHHRNDTISTRSYRDTNISNLSTDCGNINIFLLLSTITFTIHSSDAGGSEVISAMPARCWSVAVACQFTANRGTQLCFKQGLQHVVPTVKNFIWRVAHFRITQRYFITVIRIWQICHRCHASPINRSRNVSFFYTISRTDFAVSFEIQDTLTS